MTQLTAWILTLVETVRGRMDGEEGQTGIEYAMVAVVIVAAVGAAYVVAGPTIQGVITSTLARISGLVSNAITAAAA